MADESAEGSRLKSAPFYPEQSALLQHDTHTPTHTQIDLSTASAALLFPSPTGPKLTSNRPHVLQGLLGNRKTLKP